MEDLDDNIINNAVQRCRTYNLESDIFEGGNDYSAIDEEFRTINLVDDIEDVEDNGFPEEDGEEDGEEDDDQQFNSDIAKPKIGDEFDSLIAAVNMYRKYALSVGFNIRLASETRYDEDNTIRKKHIRCNRYGQPRKKHSHQLLIDGVGKHKRNSYSKACGCMAMIGVHRDRKTDKFTIYSFEENHNHFLDKSISEMMSKENRKLRFSDKHFILNASAMNIGPTKAHKINCSLKGGYGHFRPTKVEYKNFWRDYRNIVGKNDAQCVVDQLTIRKESCENFFFDFKLDKKTLVGLFWADEISKENYTSFSDVISLDATYRTNRYNMVFVPFTAINNHMKTITVGAALLASETIESYTWILNCFLKAHGKAPTLILSDEDPALKQAIQNVLPDTNHRFCMWHIMTKMPSKVSSDVLENTEFRSRIHKLVWNSNQSTFEFEEKWNSIIRDYELDENAWLQKVYRMKDKWIPCYFNHISMSGLMKTTSRSESSNSYFNKFSKNSNLLVNFMFNFDTAMSKQRHEQRKLDVKTNTTKPTLLSDNFALKIEIDASEKYTRNVFVIVQKEIKKALTKCYQTNVIDSGDTIVCNVVYKTQDKSKKHEFQVTFNEADKIIDCSCSKFNSIGILCCHCFRIFMDYEIDEIPKRYVKERWRKMHAKPEIQLGKNKDLMDDFIQELKKLKIKYEEKNSSQNESHGNEELVESFFGVRIPDTIEIEAPDVIRNKGCGNKNRLKSGKEKAILNSLKVKRMCKGCNQLVNHDKRNCPINPSKPKKN